MLVSMYLAPGVAIEQLGDVRLDIRLLQGARKALGVDADWECGHTRQGAVVLHAFRRPLHRAVAFRTPCVTTRYCMQS